MATAVALPLTVLLAVVLYLVGRPDSAPNGAEPSAIPQPTGSPVHVPKVPRTEIADRWCPKMLSALPVKVGGLERRKVSGGNEYAAAWGNPAVIVHCGVPRPKGLTKTANLREDDRHVVWLTPRGDSDDWVVVDRSVYIAVTVPQAYSAYDVLLNVSDVIDETLAKRPITFS